MFCLVFYRNNQAVMRHGLKGDIVTIGRDPTSDIQLTEDDISRCHIELSWQNGGYNITDKSTNGTYLNDKRIETSRLEPNDTIGIGEWRIKFETTAENTNRHTIIKDHSPTRILKYESKKKELISETIELTVIMPDGKKRNYSVTKAAIGSSPGNDIVIADEYISGNHCIIKNKGEDFVLEDLNSRNGTFLGSKKIASQKLPQKGTVTVGKAIVKFFIKQQTEKLRPAAVTSMGPIIGKSETMRELFSLLARIAPSDAAICIAGESGTGKELVARYVHETSLRHTQPFVAINCGAIPANLIESELFGHEKGSFTSATSQHPGVFEQASGGTLFFDEIGEMPTDLQTRLLRVLETRQLRRVGGEADIPVDARVITATNRNLRALVKENRFREDLFFRLYVVPVNIQPLRERKEDIELLAEHFLSELSLDGGTKRLSDGALNKLRDYDWPGNVRELKNTIQRAILISQHSIIAKEDILFSTSLDKGQRISLEEQERKSVMEALKGSGGNTSAAARKLGIARTTIASMIKRFGIDPKKMRLDA